MKPLVKILVSLSLGLVLLPMSVSASFNIKPHIPENQLEDRTDVLNLRVKEAETQELLFDISNDTNEEATYSLAISNASTTSSGTIDYLNVEAIPDGTQKYRLTSLLSIDKTVTVPANSKKTIKGILKTPESFDGIVMGSLQLINGGSQAESGTGIINNLVMSLPILLTMNDKQLDANLELLNVKPAVSAGKTQVILGIHNPQPVIMPELELSYEITQKGKKIQNDKKKISMAPNSLMNYSVDLDKAAFKAGEYEVHVGIDSEYGNWDWSESFTLKQDEANEFNKQIIKEPIDFKKYIIPGIMVLLISIVGFLLYKLKKVSEK